MPIFVDERGRRARLWRWAAMAGSLLGLAYLTLAAVSVISTGSLTGLPWPARSGPPAALTDTHPARPVPTSVARSSKERRAAGGAIGVAIARPAAPARPSQTGSIGGAKPPVTASAWRPTSIVNAGSAPSVAASRPAVSHGGSSSTAGSAAPGRTTSATTPAQTGKAVTASGQTTRTTAPGQTTKTTSPR